MTTTMEEENERSKLLPLLKRMQEVIAYSHCPQCGTGGLWGKSRVGVMQVGRPYGTDHTGALRAAHGNSMETEPCTACIEKALLIAELQEINQQPVK